MEKELAKVKDALEDFGKQIAEAVKKGAGEAGKVPGIAQVKIEIGSLKRQQKDLFQELGELFYKNYSKATKKEQEDIAEAVTGLTEIDKKIASLNRTLKGIKEGKQTPRRRGRPPKSAAKVDAPAKRRGRPPKSEAKEKAPAPKKRGRPLKAATVQTGEPAPKRRGRPPKSAKTA